MSVAAVSDISEESSRRDVPSFSRSQSLHPLKTKRKPEEHSVSVSKGALWRGLAHERRSTAASSKGVMKYETGTSKGWLPASCDVVQARIARKADRASTRRAQRTTPNEKENTSFLKYLHNRVCTAVSARTKEVQLNSAEACF